MFLDDDNQLDKVVDEAEMDAAAMDEDGKAGGKDEGQLARIVRKSYEEMDTLPSSEEEESDSDSEPVVEQEPEPFDPELFAALQRIRQHAAARLIQRVWRAYVARKMLELARLREEEERRRALLRAAAVQIQRRWRGILGRRRLQELLQQRRERAKTAMAATHVQRIARGMLARLFCTKLRERNRMAERHGAAMEIQRFARGMMARWAWSMHISSDDLSRVACARYRCRMSLARVDSSVRMFAWSSFSLAIAAGLASRPRTYALNAVSGSVSLGSSASAAASASSSSPS